MQELHVAAPTSHPSISPKLASRRSRWLAAIIDGALALLIVAPVAHSTEYFPAVWRGDVPLSVSLVIGFVSLVQYPMWHGWLLHRSGQTIGKWLLNIRIASYEDQRIPSLRRTVLLRFGCFAVLTRFGLIGSLAYFLNVMAIFRHDHRCLHDLLAYTHVIQCDSEH